MYLPSSCTPGAAMTSIPAISTGLSGLGCGCGCGGGCNEGLAGLTMDGSGLFGTGIFGTGVTLTDISTWGPAEVFTIALGGYTLISLLFTTKHVAATRIRVSRKK
jgi:hypothetical protein